MRSPHANEYDRAVYEKYQDRDADWRNGAVVYQIFVDRFAPSEDIDSKKNLYSAPRTFHEWNETPSAGHYLEKEQVHSHELDFWGGDLKSIIGKLDYINTLGVNVVYLNPIHLGFTNHKYDALDYLNISPEYGTQDDLKQLAQSLHDNDIKLVLDGVFNHMGKEAPIFQQAKSHKNSVYRQWFYFDKHFEHGYRAWENFANLPELNLENKEVQDHVFAKKSSVIQHFLKMGIDGWRLDVAFDIGFNLLTEITSAAHKRKPGSLVVGEAWNYPKEWDCALDGVLNFTMRRIILEFCKGDISARTASDMLDRLIEDTRMGFLLKSWLMLDNHDTPRLKNLLPECYQQDIAQVLQFTLPGSPNVYYGNELGMEGGEDPENRAPMRWDIANKENLTLNWIQHLIALRKRLRALRIGNYRSVCSENLLAFERYTDRAAETVIVVINLHDREITESLMIANSKLMSHTNVIDQLHPEAKTAIVQAGFIKVTMEPLSAYVFTPDTESKSGYTKYKRVQ